MVLESLISPFKAKKRPYEVFFIGALYSTIALFLSLWVFQSYASLVMVFLIVLASVPLLYFTINAEEELDFKIARESILLKEHGKALLFLILLFLGITAALVFWYVTLPLSWVQNLFSVQSQTIIDINLHLGSAAQFSHFSKIFLNNLRVLIFCLLFAFLYGAGAIFILTWNATVIATAIGNFIRTNLALASGTFGLSTLNHYLSVSSFGFLRYLTHGLPEITAYFIAGLAGGIISFGIIKKDLTKDIKERIIFDSTELIILALALLVLAALIETYVTPVLF